MPKRHPTSPASPRKPPASRSTPDFDQAAARFRLTPIDADLPMTLAVRTGRPVVCRSRYDIAAVPLHEVLDGVGHMVEP